ncbi:MAG: DUF2752 domain-containing protein [Candidatus Polarisedimenticolia bacterium]|nr:DUF2752 domain-containing protein [bacterium]
MESVDPKVSFRRARLAAAATALIVLAAAWLYAPHVHDGPVICPFRLITGLPCPGCGLTRSFCAMAVGDWRDAFADNVFGPPLFALTLATPLLALTELWLGRALAWRRLMYDQRVAAVLCWAVGGVHAARLLWWGIDGTLWSDYFSRSWIVWVWRRFV